MIGFTMVKKEQYQAMLDELAQLRENQSANANANTAFTAIRDALAFEGTDEELSAAIAEQLTAGATAATDLTAARAAIENLKATIAERDKTIAALKDLPVEESASASTGTETKEPTATAATTDPEAIKMPDGNIAKAAKSNSLAEAIQHLIKK